MHWETCIEPTFDYKGDLHCITDKGHIGMPMSMPSFANGRIKVKIIIDWIHLVKYRSVWFLALDNTEYCLLAI